MSVTRAEQQAAWREDHMRQELADMQQVRCMCKVPALVDMIGLCWL